MTDMVHEQYDRQARREDAVPTNHTTIIERRSGGPGGFIMGMMLVLALVIGSIIALQFLRTEQIQTDAISNAAGEVGAAAHKVGDTAQDAADKIPQN